MNKEEFIIQIFENIAENGHFTYNQRASQIYKDAVRVLRDEGYINNHQGGYRFIPLFKGEEVIN